MLEFYDRSLWVILCHFPEKGRRKIEKMTQLYTCSTDKKYLKPQMCLCKKLCPILYACPKNAKTEQGHNSHKINLIFSP